MWNPLIIVEFAGSGHSDIIGIFFMVFSIWLLLAGRLYWSNAALVFSFLTKFISALYLPVILYLKKKNRIVLVLMFIALTALFYLPYADAGERLFTGLKVYSSKWRFNASIFEVIFRTVKSLLPDSVVVKYMIAPYGYAANAETIATRGADLALLLAKGIVAVLFIGWLVYYLKRLPRDLSREGSVWIFKFGLFVLGAFFLLNPTLQPWYVAWLMPLLVVAPNRAWILFTGLVGLSYWILIDYTQLGVWQESTWVRLVEYVPFYLLLTYDAVRAKLQE